MELQDGDFGTRLLSDYTQQKFLGSGAFGLVFDCLNKMEDRRCAVKLVLSGDDEGMKEVSNIAKLSHHQNIIQYHNCWKDKFSIEGIRQLLAGVEDSVNFQIPYWRPVVEFICIQTELCAMDLRKWLEKRTTVKEQEHVAVSIFFQSLNGVNHIHSKGFIHRDLKPENIFFSLDGLSIKIGDFGIAAPHISNASAKHTTGRGTPIYLAPEQGTGKYGKQVDIFALGLILFELYSVIERNQLAPTLLTLREGGKVPETFREQWPNIAKTVEEMITRLPKSRPEIKTLIQQFAEMPAATGQLLSQDLLRDMGYEVSSIPTGGTTTSTSITPTTIEYHFNVICDNCREHIFLEVRYKCTVCEDYDLCEKCKKVENVHTERHDFEEVKGKTFTMRYVIETPFARSGLGSTVVVITNDEEFKNALANLEPGDSLELGEGNFEAPKAINCDNVVLNGQGETTILLLTETDLLLSGSRIFLKDLMIKFIASSDSELGGPSIVVAGMENRLENVGIIMVGLGNEISCGIIISGDKNIVTNSSVSRIKTLLKTVGDDNRISNFKGADGNVSIYGERNVLLSSSILMGKLLINGDKSKVTNCVAEKIFLESYTESRSESACRSVLVSNCVFNEASIDGDFNTLIGVECNQTITVYGKGITLKKCRGQVLALDPGALGFSQEDNVFDKIGESARAVKRRGGNKPNKLVNSR